MNLNYLWFLPLGLFVTALIGILMAIYIEGLISVIKYFFLKKQNYKDDAQEWVGVTLFVILMVCTIIGISKL